MRGSLLRSSNIHLSNMPKKSRIQHLVVRLTVSRRRTTIDTYSQRPLQKSTSFTSLFRVRRTSLSTLKCMMLARRLKSWGGWGRSYSCQWYDWSFVCRSIQRVLQEKFDSGDETSLHLSSASLHWRDSVRRSGKNEISRGLEQCRTKRVISGQMPVRDSCSIKLERKQTISSFFGCVRYGVKSYLVTAQQETRKVLLFYGRNPT